MVALDAVVPTDFMESKMLDHAFQRALRPPILHRSLKLALVVGTLLNLSNQGDRLFGSGDVNWIKLVLTFLVPFCVATSGAWAALKDGHDNPPI